MKRILITTALLASSPSFAAGPFFNVTATGNPANVNITLCLNAIGEFSCQKYSVSALNLKILAMANFKYDTAGIQINSAFYSLDTSALNCTPIINDKKHSFCMFSVSKTMPANINLKGPDYVVIGAGTAGAVLAKKLSDDNQSFVVALHNGPNLNQDPLINLSKNAIFTVLAGLIGPPLYVLSETIQQASADNRILNWIYALPLGGASSVNAGAWCRASNQVNAQWETIAGANWSVATIQNTYVGLENYTGQTSNPSARGFNGPLPIYQATPITRVSQIFSNAIVSATAVPLILDYNDPLTPIGAAPQVQYTQMGTNGDLRASSAIVFLNKNVMDNQGNGVNGRKLRVLFNVTADNVIWDGNKAVGVNYYENGIRKSIYAAKAVVVSAGVKSSSFLMRSGVGPASLLQSLGIPVIYDNPNVGAGLADQPRIALIYITNPDDTPSSTLSRLTGKVISALAQTDIGRAIIANIGQSINVSNGIFSQIAWLPDPTGDPSIRALRFASLNPIPGISVALFDLTQPKSRGSIAITSRDPFVEPTMDFGILSNVDDLDLYVRGFQTYIKDINIQLPSGYQMIFPNPDIIDDTTALSSFIQNEIQSNMHFQSHCRIAALNQGGVVDSTGHVHGVQNLVVADDSIVPVGMDGSPMATAYLIAANVANLLLV